MGFDIGFDQLQFRSTRWLASCIKQAPCHNKGNSVTYHILIFFLLVKYELLPQTCITRRAESPHVVRGLHVAYAVVVDIWWRAGDV